LLQQSVDLIEQDIVELVGEYDCEVALVGDFNAHCGKLSDILDYDIHINKTCGLSNSQNAQYGLFDPPARGLTIPQRSSLERSPTNNFGHRLTDLLKSVGLQY
jgi:hypothetical protein